MKKNKISQLVVVAFLTITSVSAILMVDLYITKGLLLIGPEKETGAMILSISLLYLTTGIITWKHADETCSLNSGAWLIIEPLISVTMGFVSLVGLIGAGFTLFSSPISKEIIKYCANAATMPLLFGAIVLLFTFYLRHINRS